ncbi:MAG: hypothetical protein ACPG21_09565 [Crocinitomicaceae bacterium]
MNLKLDVIICQSTWQMAYNDGMSGADSNASETEKNITRALREFFSMSTDTFNDSRKRYDELSADEKKAMYKNLDPLTQMVTIWCCYCVADVENEDDGWISDAEWDWLYSNVIKHSYYKNKELRKQVNDLCWPFARKITNPNLLDDTSIETLEAMEATADGTLGKEYINPILVKVFDYYENNKLYTEWESAYKTLKRNYKELKGLFGEFDMEIFDDVYGYLKYLIQDEKKAAKEAAEKQRKQEEKEENEAALLAKEEAKAQKLKEHRFKTSKGETFCQYCGREEKYLKFGVTLIDCSGRPNGHNYVMMKKDNEWKPICNKCGGDSTYDEFSCG